MGTQHASSGRLWLLALGFCVWCSALGLVYVVHSIGCSFHWPTGAIRLGLAGVIVVHLGAAGWLWRSLAAADRDDPTASFLHWVILWTSVAAFVTIIVTLGPTLLLTTCT